MRIARSELFAVNKNAGRPVWRDREASPDGPVIATIDGDRRNCSTLSANGPTVSTAVSNCSLLTLKRALQYATLVSLPMSIGVADSNGVVVFMGTLLRANYMREILAAL